MKLKTISSFFIIGFLVTITGCFSTRDITVVEENVQLTEGANYCDTVSKKRSVFIKSADAAIKFDEDEYSTKVSLYYLVDSMIIISAVNTGFEIIRAGIFKDSIIIINRLDKLVYKYKEEKNIYELPLTFSELVLLINKFELCEKKKELFSNSEIVDFSNANITKKVILNTTLDSITNFEFFHKKTGEYVIGEKVRNDEILIYANYVMGNFEVRISGGKVKYNDIMDYNAYYNPSKYTIIDLQ